VQEEQLKSGSLISSGNLYQKMIEEIQDYAIIILDKNGYIQNWNKGAQKIKLYSEKEVIGKHFSTFYLPEDLANNLSQKLLKEAETTGVASQEGWRQQILALPYVKKIAEIMVALLVLRVSWVKEQAFAFIYL
jgi:transcriptional regulator with PAS, ATPase and Fis domain